MWPGVENKTELSESEFNMDDIVLIIDSNG